MSLIIRPANAADTPLIIALLKKSLGESTIPKSEKLWNWKHSENPFGASAVLVAEDRDTLVGVRAFMKWKWSWKGKQYHSVRAVDTATHPDFQGKGIFKKLTLQLAADCQEKGVDFIFNTPNTQSLPGYLKMGWVAHGKLDIKFRPLRPFALGYAMFFDKKKYVHITDDPTPVKAWDSQLLESVVNVSADASRISTPITPAYLSWRYAFNPLFRYTYFTDQHDLLIIARIKQQAFSRELRIVECLRLREGIGKPQGLRHIKREIMQFCRKHDIDIISMSGAHYQVNKALLGWMGMLPALGVGPIITLKDLTMKEEFPLLLSPSNWGYTLGDLELF